MSDVHEPRRSIHRRAVTLGVIVFLTGCAPTGCAPGDEPSGNVTTTTSDKTTTTTGDPKDTTTTTEEPSDTTTTSEEPSDTTTTSTTEPEGPTPSVRVEELKVEDCFSPADADTFVDRVLIIDCATPHRMEVFAEYELDAETDYPGGNQLTWDAKDACRDRFDAYVGYSYLESDFDLLVLTPSFSTWDVGDRAITCLVVDPDDGLITGSAKNAGR